MPTQREQPPEAWRNLIECFWVGSSDLSRDGGFLVTPDQFADLLFFDSDVAACDDGVSTALPRCVLLGPLARPIRLFAPGEVRCAGIRLRAWVLGHALPHGSAAHPWADASIWVCPWGGSVFAGLRAYRSEQIYDGLRSLARELLIPIAQRSTGAAMAFARGASLPRSADDVGAALGVGPRHARRLFRSWTNLSPKAFFGIARFQLARDLLWHNPQMPLVNLAFEAGYTDQAHFTREFRRYSGMTPGAFARKAAASAYET